MKNLTLNILLVLTAVGGFLRFYHLSQTLQFLGDQGRDALIVRRLLIDHDPVFIGPVTSVGNMYLGPAYYYFMVPFLALTYPSPMGPVYAVAFIGTITIPLMYLLGKELVGKRAALLATVFYTFGWTFIFQSRFSWNPNPAPIVSLFMIWATYRAWTKRSVYWILVSFCFSLLIQLHYMTLLALPAAGIFWLISLYEHWKKKVALKSFFVHTVIAIMLFLVSLTPLVLFDLKHEFLNAKAFYNITFGKEDQVRTQRDTFKIIEETVGKSRLILFEVTTNELGWLNLIMVICVFMLVVVLLKQTKSEQYKGRLVLICWLGIGILGTSLYKSSVFHHYIAYLFPVTCFVLAMVLAYCWEQKWLKFLVPAFLVWFFAANLMNYDYSPVSWTVRDMENYSKQIISHISTTEPYSLVGINSYNDIYAMNYRYYLTAWGSKPLETEDANSAKQLVIVNENYMPVQKVLDLPIYELVIFPNKGDREVTHFDHAPDLIILHR